MESQTRKLLAVYLAVLVTAPVVLTVGGGLAAGNTLSVANDPVVGDSPMVDAPDAEIDPSSDSTIPVSYNVEDEGVPASDLALLLIDGDGNLLNKQSLPATKQDNFSAVIPAGAVTADGTLTASVYDTSGDTLSPISGASDTSSVTVTDPTAPTVSAVSLGESEGDLTLTFESSEPLDTLSVTVDGPNSGTDWVTFTRNDFTELDRQDGYSYELSVTQAYDDGDGVYAATVDDAVDAAGNNGGENGAGSDLSATYDTSGPSVESSSVDVVDGPGSASSLQVDAFYASGLLQVQIKDSEGSYELADDGITASTRIETTVTVSDDNPRALIGNGHDVSWTRTDNGDGTTTLVISGRPSETDHYFPSPDTWPGDLTATDHRDLSMTFATDSMSSFPSDRRDRLDGIVFMTDAQSFAPPRYNTSGATDAIEFDVSAPHYAADGSTNQGFVEAYIPQPMLDHWGVSTGAISGTYNGESRTTTITERSDGVLAELSVHYSSGTAAFTVDTEAPTASAGSDRTVEEGTSVSFDGSSSQDNTAVETYEWDFDGDGSTDATGATASHTFAEPGTYDVTLTVTDAAGNADTTTVTVTVESAEDGGSSSADSSDRGGSNAPVTVSRNGDVTNVRVRDAAEAGPIDLGDRGEVHAVGVDSLSLDTSANEFTLDVSAHRSVPDGTPLPDRTDVGESTAGYLQIDHSVADGDISGVTIGFTVGWDALTSGTNASEVVLYRHHDGEWQPLATEFVRYTDRGARFEAESPGLSVFAVGSETATAFSVSPTAPAGDLAVGDSVTVSARVSNDGTAAGTKTVALRADGAVRATQNVTLDPGESTTIELSTALDAAGDYDLTVDGVDAGTVSVTAASTAESTVSATPTATPTSESPSVVTATGTPESGPDAVETAAPTATATDSAGGPGFGAGLAALAVLALAIALARRRD
ncbi:PKD domain-containing protein [Halosimplex sp. TS25]|uniref:PKD domain-containing protein n=1 Tax=Halosimplex rarum TaxID=3396619 RepID=UPI0039ED1FA6